jgi:peptide/nickel transport system permease protein
MKTTLSPTDVAMPEATAVQAPSRSFWMVVLRQLRQDRVAMISIVVLAIIIGAAIFAPWCRVDWPP